MMPTVRLPRLGAIDTEEIAITHQIGKLILLQIFAIPGLLGLPLVAESADLQRGESGKSATGAIYESADVLHIRISGKREAYTALAQSDAPASIFSPWSDKDVRQGAATRDSAPATSQGVSKPEAYPQDVRRSSAPSKDAIPLIQRTGRDDLEDIRLGSRPEAGRTSGSAARSTARESFITLQPFSDGDVRQGSRRQQSPAAQPVTTSTKPTTEVTEKEKKGLLGRMLDKIGF